MTSSTAQKTCIIFDIDGTLVQSVAFDGELYEQAIREVLNIPLESDRSHYEHVTDIGILRQAMHEHDLKPSVQAEQAVKLRFCELIFEYILENPSHIQAVSGALGFIDKLSQRSDIVFGFATGGWRETAQAKLLAIGFDTSKFPNTSFASSNDHVARTDIMRCSEQQLALSDKDRRIYFGDGPWDQLASQQLDYEFVAIGDKLKHSPQFEDFSRAEDIFEALAL